MAKARALDRRRKSIRNIRKITRTMELISTATFRRAMDRALAAGPPGGLRSWSATSRAREARHCVAAPRTRTRPARARNRGLRVLTAACCAGRIAVEGARGKFENLRLGCPASGASVSAARSTRIGPSRSDRPRLDRSSLAKESRAFEAGGLNRLDIVTRSSVTRRYGVGTLLPVGDAGRGEKRRGTGGQCDHEFCPRRRASSPRSCLSFGSSFSSVFWTRP